MELSREVQDQVLNLPDIEGLAHFAAGAISNDFRENSLKIWLCKIFFNFLIFLILTF